MRMRMKIRISMRKKNDIDNMKKIYINNWLDTIIDKSKSFEDQIKSLKKIKDPNPRYMNDYDDKELKFKIFKLKLADL